MFLLWSVGLACHLSKGILWQRHDAKFGCWNESLCHSLTLKVHHLTSVIVPVISSYVIIIFIILYFSSEDEDEEEEEEELELDDSEESDVAGRNRRGGSGRHRRKAEPVRRSTRARITRFDKEFSKLLIIRE
jgi:hypothetical protein